MLCLFVSGMAGLVYEIVWARYLALFLGHASYAVVAVLVAFMGGLALGNLWIGSRADRTARPLAWYAWVEIGIGAYALIFPTYYGICYDAVLGLARRIEPGSTGLLALKFGFSLLTILLPTVLMGGTLPLLIRLLTRSLGEVQRQVAALYLVNSAGGVLGIWLADFVLLESIGLESTVLAGAAMNLGVGGLALAVSGWLKEGRVLRAPAAGSDPGAPPGPASPGPAESYGPVDLRLALVGIGLSGFVAMLYQVAWTRLLALALGSSTHAFSLMLMTFIAGLTAGAAIVYRWRRLRRTLEAFGWVELALAATVALSLVFYEFLPYAFARLAQLLTRRPEAYGLYQLLQGLVCAAVLFLPTLWLGMTLPLVCRAATPTLERRGQSVGRVFAVNTLGTVLGAILTGLVLLPRLGLAQTFGLGVGLNILVALLVLARRGSGCPRWAVVTAGVAALAFVLGSGPVLNRSWRGALTLGLWRQRQVATNWLDFHATATGAKILYYCDGAGATVSVHTPPEVPGGLFLKVNGKTDASSTGDMTTQLLLGHLPLLLRPSCTNALVVGLGCGATAGAVAAHSSIQRVDVVEIAPEVREAARLFDAHNRRVLDDPRVRVTIDDAKSFLLLSGTRYDTIISEPSNPWMVGVAGVFSLEFYQQCRAHLAPDGVMVQWVQLYEFSDAGLDMVLATFSQVFPYVSVWHTDGFDILLIGSPNTPAWRPAPFAARLAEAAVRADLDRVKLANAPLLLSHELISPAYGAALPPQNTRLHSDFYPALEFIAQRDFFVRDGASRFRRLDENFSRRPTTLFGAYLREHRLVWADFEAFAHSYLDTQKPFLDLIVSVLLRWRQDFPDAWEPREAVTRFKTLATPGELDTLRLQPVRDQLLERARQNPTLLRHYGLALMRTYREQRSCLYAPPADELSTILDRLIQLDPAHQRVYQAYQAEIAWDRGDDAACEAFGQHALLGDLPRGNAMFELDPASPLRIIAVLADVLGRRGQWTDAAALCDAAVHRGFLENRSPDDTLWFEVTRRRVDAEKDRLSTARVPLRAP
jgi:spermidine synthase